MEWTAHSAVSVRRFTGYAISSAIGTLGNDPEEYGPHWDGYGKRVGLRASTGATSLFMESSLGALWGEDPRYVRASQRPVRGRLLSVVQQAFLAHDQNGKLMPAYARYIAIPASNYLTNAWRPDSTTTNIRTFNRIQLAFLDRLIANAVTEFAPDLIRRIRRKDSHGP